MPEQIRRHIAFKVKIKDLLDGRYITGGGDWDPNYIQLNDKQISRVNLLGVIVSKQNDINSNHNSVLLDDGSGRIPIRSFGNDKTLNGFEVGDVVLIIGRPREFGNERYIVPEIIKKNEDKKWIEVRKLELRKHREKIKKDVSEKQNAIEEEIIENADPATKIFEMIKKSDSGNGVDIQEVVDKSNVGNSEKIIENLLETGEIFEIKPGRLKVLE